MPVYADDGVVAISGIPEAFIPESDERDQEPMPSLE